MRVVYVSVIFLLSLCGSNAFTTCTWGTVRPEFTVTRFLPSSSRFAPSLRLYANAEADDSFEVYEKLVDELDEAAEEAIEAEERVLASEQQISAIQAEIESIQRQLKEGDSEWQREKAIFAIRIADLTNKLQGKEEDTKQRKKALTKENEESMRALEQQLEGLKSILQKAQTALERERKLAEDSRVKLYKAEDSLEFEQMRFDKEKKELSDKIQGELGKLKKVESQFAQEKNLYAEEKRSLQSRIKEEEKKLSQAQSQLERDTKRFENDKKELSAKLETQSSKLSETEQKLQEDQSRQRREAEKLRKAVDEERNKLRKTEEQLRREEREFASTKQDMESRIARERTRVAELTNKLESRKVEHIMKKDVLETRIEEERTKLEEIKQQLELESQTFQVDKRRLEQKVSDGERVRNLKSRQMANRYERIEKEMTDLWQSAKRQGQDERRAMTIKYEAELAVVTDNIDRLESALYDERQIAGDLQQLVNDVAREKMNVIEDQKKRESQFVRQVAQKNAVISGLRTDVKSLTTELKSRDAIIEEYETSFGRILSQTVKLSGKRIRRGGTRLRNLVARRKDDE